MMDEREIMALVRKYLPHAYFNSPNAACRLSRAIRNAALEESALAVRKLIEDHAASAKEPVGDTSCDFQCAWVDAENAIRALKTKEGE